MLVKNNKISKKNDFDYIFKNGKSAKSVFFILKFIQNSLKANRFAFMVSKKVSPKAVIRNKVRRRLSESVKEFKKETEKGMDVIFVALPAIKEKSFAEIKEETAKLLKKII
jgi:ribonuclease P protein component